VPPHPDDRRLFIAGLAASVAAASAHAAETPPADGFDAVKALLAGKRPLTWVFTGDSITHGALHTLGWRSYPEHFAERVRWELRRMRDVVINTGISGDRTGGLLADLDWRVLRFKPDVVSVMLGMNDCSAGPAGRDVFRQNLTAIAQKCAAAGAVVVLNTPNTIYVKNAAARADLPAYADAVRAAAGPYLLVDHWKEWSAAKPDPEKLLAWLEDRSIHPNVYGHRAFARSIFRAFGVFDPNSPTCKLDVP
jgi:acyl-CoA thioesterase-1